MRDCSKRITAFIFVLIFVIVGLYRISALTRLKASEPRDLLQKNYFDCPNDYDVLFLGTSHVMFGVNPLIIWNESGLTSYNWGSPTCTIPMQYWKLKCILEVAKPKLVVVDCFRATWSDKGHNDKRMHEAFDAFNLSKTKYNAICDLMDADEEFTRKDRYNMLFPLGAYHSRWDDLQKIDFCNKYLDLKGCEELSAIAEPIATSKTKEKLEVTDDMTGVTYLRKIIEECKENDIQILLMYLPYPTDEFWKQESNMIYDIAKEYDVNYINFTEEDVVNYYTDCHDSASHLNFVGHIKVSNYLADYLVENYDISNRWNDSSLVDNWYTLYSEYIDASYSRFKSASDLQNYLMYAYYLPFDYVIDIRNSQIVNNRVYKGLIEQLGIDGKILSENTDFIVKYGGECVVLNDFRNDDDNLYTDLGEFRLVVDKNNTSELYLNGRPIYSSFDDDYDMKIFMIRDGVMDDFLLVEYDVDDDFDVVVSKFERNCQ